MNTILVPRRFGAVFGLVSVEATIARIITCVDVEVISFSQGSANDSSIRLSMKTSSHLPRCLKLSAAAACAA